MKGGTKHLNKFMGFRRILIISLLFTFIILSFDGSKISAQQQSSANSNTNPSPSPSTTPTPTPTPIPLSSIIRETENTEKRLQEIKQKVSEQSSTPGMQADLSQLVKDIDTREQNTNQLIATNPSLELLDRNESYWSSLSLLLPSRKERFQSEAETMSALLVELQNIQSVWNITKLSLETNPTETQNNIPANTQNQQENTNLHKNKNHNSNVNLNSNSNNNSSPESSDGNLVLPDNFRNKVAEILEKIKQVENAVQKNLSDLIKLQENVSEIEKRTNDMIEKISVARNSILSNLIIRDSPPIWSRESFSSSFPLDAEKSFSEKLQSLKSYIAEHTVNFLLHFLVILTLILIFHRARRKTRLLVEKEPKLKTGLIIFEFPVSSALILGFFLAPLFHLQSPELLTVIASPILVISIFVLFRQLIDKKYIPILFALVILYLINDLRLLTASIPFLSRVIFLFEIMGGIVFLLWLIRTHKQSEDSPNSDAKDSKIRTIAIFSLIPFVFAFLANSFGYVGLSGLIGRAIVLSLSLGLILYAIVQVADSLLIFISHIPPFSKLRMITSNRILIQDKIFKIIKWLAVVVWFAIILAQSYLLDPFIKLIEKILDSEFKIGAVGISLGGILLFIFIVWFSFLLSRFIRFILDEDIYPRVKMANGLPYATSTILHYLILLGGVFLALAAMGIDLTKFTIFLGALGVGVGIGLQNIVENFTSGLILLLERPIKIGDLIQIDQHQGELKQIGLRASIVKTFDGAEIIVPNGQLITQEVTNWTLSDHRRRIEINIGVDYSADPENVIEILENIGKNHPEIDKEIAPRAIFVEFGDNSLNFQLRLWTSNHANWIIIKSDLSINIYKALKEAEIPIPFPQRDLHIKSIDEQLLTNFSQVQKNKDKIKD